MSDFTKEELKLIAAADLEIQELIKDLDESEIKELEDNSDGTAPGAPVDIEVDLDEDGGVESIDVSLGHDRGFWFNVEPGESATGYIEDAIEYARDNADLAARDQLID